MALMGPNHLWVVGSEWVRANTLPCARQQLPPSSFSNMTTLEKSPDQTKDPKEHLRVLRGDLIAKKSAARLQVELCVVVVDLRRERQVRCGRISGGRHL
eukprot:m.62519 g.62519  ORF g.62519 m.62519 type:complete len:99 (-) comp49567_c0_seq1:52-348(-)